MRIQTVLFVIGLLLLRIGVQPLLTYTHPGLDNSWAQALLLAIQKGETFGTDFVFNYGPLGYLNFKTIGPTTSKWFILFVELFTLFHLYSFWRALSKKFPQNSWFLGLLMLFLLYPFGSIADFSFSYFFFLVFWLQQATSQRNTYALFIAVTIVVLLFFVKLNINVLVVVVFLVTTLLGAMLKRFSWVKAICSILCLAIGIFAGAKMLQVNLPNYLKSAFLLIDSYPDGMSEFILNKQELMIFGLINLILIFLIIRYIKQHLSWDFLTIYFILVALGLLFLNHKQAHTAISPPNEYGFLNFIPWLFLLIWLVLPAPSKFPGYTGSFWAVLLFCLVGQQNYWFSNANKNVNQYIKQAFQFRVHPIQHVQDYLNYKYQNHFKNNEKPLPSVLLAKIGNASVDIFQQDIDYLFFNQLNYEHRPIIQSYQVCSSELMDLNGKKFESTSAPAFVIYKSISFRKQNPMWVETPSHLALLKHYRVVGQYITSAADSLLLLQKTARAKNPPVLVKDFGSVALNQEIVLPKTDSILVGTFNFQYSFLGKLSKTFFQPPYLYARVTYENGEKEDFRVVNQVLRGGILLNRKITTQLELKQFFDNAGAKNPRIISIYFYSPFPIGFKN